jgi:hypothetical protein
MSSRQRAVGNYLQQVFLINDALAYHETSITRTARCPLPTAHCLPIAHDEILTDATLTLL